MRRLGSILALSCGLLACAPGNEAIEGAGQRGARDAIINGQTTSGYPAVVMLMMNGQVFCSGTVIAPRKVLTAAHCASGGVLADAIGIGASDQAIVQEIAVVGSTPHPQYDDQQLTHDVAVVTLAEDAPVTPVALNPSMDASWVGSPILLVGFGVDDGANQTGSGQKRMVEVGIGQVTATHVLYDDAAGKSACNGDSGGPALIDQNNVLTVVAVASYVNQQGCTGGGGHVRVDAYLDFIDGELAQDPADPNAWPPDPGDPNDPPPDPGDPGACGGVTYEGYCDGNAVVWCEEGEIWMYDCEGWSCGYDGFSGLYDCL